MAFMNIEDDTGRLSITMWPKSFSEYEKDLDIGNIILVSGKTDVKRNPTLILGTLKVVKKV
jgi:DNA polymerase III alpha subunit